MDKTHENNTASFVLPLATPKQLSQNNPALTLGSIRKSIFEEHDNGLAASGAIIRMGGKILIHIPKFMTWLESGQKRKTNPLTKPPRTPPLNPRGRPRKRNPGGASQAQANQQA